LRINVNTVRYSCRSSRSFTTDSESMRGKMPSRLPRGISILKKEEEKKK
jgi:hypothetical protein